MQNTITKRILSGTSWVMLGTITSKVLAFVATLIIARILSKEVYGQLSIIRSTIQLFVSLSAFGIGATATKFIAEYRKTDSYKTVKVYCVANAFVFSMAVLSCVLLLLFANSIAINRLHQPDLAQQLRIASVILFFTLINGAQVGTLSGFEDFVRVAKCNMYMGISEIVLLCVGAYYWGLNGALIGFGITYLIAYIYNAKGINKHLRTLDIALKDVIKKLSIKDFHILYSFSLPLAATSWIQMIVYWWMKTSVVCGSSFGNMANYDIAEQWKNLILVLPNMVATVILPILSNVYNTSGDKKKVIRINLYINVVVTSVFVIFVFLFGNWILSFYGKSYDNPFPMYVLALSTILSSISSLCGTIVISANKVPWALISNIIWAVIIIIVYKILSNYYDVLENVLSLSYLISTFFQTLTMVVIVKTKKMI